jgi:hypothetical protein
MIAELDIVVFLKSDEDLERVAARVFAALGSAPEQATSDEWGGEHYTASGLGFRAVLFDHSGELLDPEFEDYQYGIEIMSEFWCVELDTVDLEGPLSEYYARQLAFDLNVETATEILLETTEDSEILEIRSFRRNPQYRLDQSPTTPKVFVVEQRQVEQPFDEVWEDEDEVVEGEAEVGEDVFAGESEDGFIEGEEEAER